MSLSLFGQIPDSVGFMSGREKTGGTAAPQLRASSGLQLMLLSYDTYEVRHGNRRVSRDGFALLGTVVLGLANTLCLHQVS